MPTIVGPTGVPMTGRYYGLPGRHGSVEPGVRPRDRDGDRGDRRLNRSRERQPQLLVGPAGPMERQDWLDALNDCKERISTLEKSDRNKASTLAEHAQYFKIVSDDITNYKEWLNGIIFNDPNSIKHKCELFESKIESIMNSSAEFLASMTDVVSKIESRVTEIEPKLESLNQWISDFNSRPQQRPAHFTLNTPGAVPVASLATIL